MTETKKHTRQKETTATIYTLKTLRQNFKNKSSWHRFTHNLDCIVEVTGFLELELERVSPRCWQPMLFITRDNSYSLHTDDCLKLSPHEFKTSIFDCQSTVYGYNSLLGVHPERVLDYELENFPHLFKVSDVDGTELSQQQLETIYKDYSEELKKLSR